MYVRILAASLVIHLCIVAYATPLPKTHKVHLLSSNHICTNITSQPNHMNYTETYTCTMKHDYAILGLYYDSCEPLGITTSTSSLPKSSINSINTTSSPLPNTILCCDSTYAQPATFDTLCVWGNGINMTEWEAAGHPAGTLPTASEEQIRNAKCFVGPIVSVLSFMLLGLKIGMEGGADRVLSRFVQRHDASSFQVRM